MLNLKNDNNKTLIKLTKKVRTWKSVLQAQKILISKDL